ncbi:MAG: hypothetical protein GEU96_17980 [Propionibacteriales bacterium]|nr:hypothetical protein [Propionibacteriales bacterium]
MEVTPKVLRESGLALRTCYQEFEAAGDHARPGSDVIGHDDLRDKLEDFADSWDENRKEMSKSIEGIGDLAVAAADGYEQLDQALRDGLEGKK